MINKNKISEVLVRNEKVKWNFWVIDIIENNILTEGFKNDLSRYRSLNRNCLYNVINGFFKNIYYLLDTS